FAATHATFATTGAFLAAFSARRAATAARLLVPDRQVGRDTGILTLDPYRDIGPVVFGHVQLRDLDPRLQFRRLRTGERENGGNKRQRQQFLHRNLLGCGRWGSFSGSATAPAAAEPGGRPRPSARSGRAVWRGIAAGR